MIAKSSEKLIDRICQLTSEFKENFGDMSVRQINWKTSADSWSIGQCIEHLIITNGRYFDEIRKVTAESPKQTVWSAIPFWSGLVGYLIQRAVDPDSRKKVRTLGLFEPNASDVPENIIADFEESQEKLSRMVKATDHLERSKIKISSPASSKLPLALDRAFEIIVIHERRHLNQAKRVAELDGFPEK